MHMLNTERRAEEAVGRREEAADGAGDDWIRRHIEDLLDQALEESFPASDPPSIAMPHEAIDAR